ncbi:cytochrome P450 family protein [Sporichthya polymorpha]|uniref:cytochrome P450 family protein n=1 Tax=Sporichthya polymorpha TaxID=35751 RepID=UPI00037172C8|nr:cytochrome P450 [Sporichthya polymorpha]
MSAPAGLNPFLATARGDRVAAYAAMASAGPVLRIPSPGGGEAWLVTGYAEARAVLNDARLVKAPPPPVTPLRRERLARAPWITTHMLVRDGAEHERLRRLVMAAFTRRRVEALAPSIQVVTDALLDEVLIAGKDGSTVDLLAQFAFPLPMTVICELMGVPAHLRDDIKVGMEPTFRGMGMADEEWSEKFELLERSLTELVATKRREPGDDLISALIEVRDDGGDRLSEDELLSMAFILIAAGHETTVHLIANGVEALLTHRPQWDLLRAEPERVPAAVEELLRWCGPVQVTFPLIAAEPLEVGGAAIGAGELVIVALLPANRDPAQVEDPDVLDVTREPRPHLGFGHGIHHCLGVALARLEARIAFETLLRRCPDLRLAVDPDELTWTPSFIFHGLDRLPVQVT